MPHSLVIRLLFLYGSAGQHTWPDHIFGTEDRIWICNVLTDLPEACRMLEPHANPTDGRDRSCRLAPQATAWQSRACYIERSVGRSLSTLQAQHGQGRRQQYHYCTTLMQIFACCQDVARLVPEPHTITKPRFRLKPFGLLSPSMNSITGKVHATWTLSKPIMAA